MYDFLYHLGAFALYTIALLFITGQTFSWNETRRVFYLGGERYGLLSSVVTYSSVWVSAATLVALTSWFLQDGYVAFVAGVLGGLLGMLFMPVLAYRLRKRRIFSIPEWIAMEYQDKRLQYLCGGVMLCSYLLFLLVLFRAFGDVAAQMLQIPAGFAATSLVYLFVLYTTFGGYRSIVKSDTLNLFIILLGVTAALFGAVATYGSPFRAHAVVAERAPEFLNGWRNGLLSFCMAICWGMVAASNPQFGMRFVTAKDTDVALLTTAWAPFVIGWVYLAVSLLAVMGRAYATPPAAASAYALAAFFEGLLPGWASLLFALAILAAAVGTANSELLLAACAFCHDIQPLIEEKSRQDPFPEDTFLFASRLSIVVIATAALLLSRFPLHGILVIGRISWTLIGVCFFLPLYLPAQNGAIRKYMLEILVVSLCLHILLSFFTPLETELSMLFVLLLQAAAFFVCIKAEKFVS